MKRTLRWYVFLLFLVALVIVGKVAGVIQWSWWWIVIPSGLVVVGPVIFILLVLAFFEYLQRGLK